MKRFNLAVSIIVLLVSTISLPAMAKPPTRAQIAELRKLVTSEQVEIFLQQHRSQTRFSPQGCMEIKVDYDLTPVEIADEFDHGHFEISDIRDENFKVKPRGEGKVFKMSCWFKFDPSVSPEEAQKKIEADGKFLSADLWELRAFGREDPDLRLSLSIIGLGSPWRHPKDVHISVPALTRGKDFNIMQMIYLNGRPTPNCLPRHSGCRFLAVLRK